MGTSLVAACMGPFNILSAASFEDEICKDVEAKHFLHESDRSVAKGIVQGYVAKRVLLDTIRAGNTEEVKRLLADLEDRGLESTLHEPVDEVLNTLLHIAVKQKSAEI